jgi:hypothetical protein
MPPRASICVAAGRACGRSPTDSVELRRRLRGSCGATRQPAADISPSMPIGEPPLDEHVPIDAGSTPTISSTVRSPSCLLSDGPTTSEQYCSLICLGYWDARQLAVIVFMDNDNYPSLGQELVRRWGTGAVTARLMQRRIGEASEMGLFTICH